MEEQSKAVSVFSFQGKDFRVKMIDGDPWFVVADVCKVLEIVNVTHAIDRLDADGVRLAEVIDSLGRTQNTTVANEPNLYRLIFRSDKPEAKAFQDEVYNKVLPSIRKTGAYVAPGSQLPLQGEVLLLPEQVTDIQAVALLSQLEELVKEEQLAPKFRSAARYNLEFALRKAQKLFEGRNLQMIEKQNGSFRIKEYPGERAQEREERNTEVAYRHLQEEYARLKEYVAQVEEELLDLRVVAHHSFVKLQEAFSEMDHPQIQAHLEKIIRWLDHMRIPNASAMKLQEALQEKIIRVLHNHAEGLNASALSQKCHLGVSDVELVLEDLVSKKVIRMAQQKEVSRVKRLYKAKGA